MKTIKEVEARVREAGPLLVRLEDCRARIGSMCSEGRPPRMSVPVWWDDDDVFIDETIKEAIEKLKELGEAP